MSKNEKNARIYTRDVILRIAEKHNISANESRKIVGIVLDEISNALFNGEDLTLTGFGSFKVRSNPSRTVRNPHTREKFTIPSRKTIGFKASVQLKQGVNK